MGSFQYDAKSQRIAEDYRYTYLFDNNGNLTQKTAKASFPVGEVTQFIYSSENQLMGMKVFPAGSSSPSKEVTYRYDALGRRIEKIVTDHAAPTDLTRTYTRRYVYDGEEILLEYSGDNELLARYTHSPSRFSNLSSARFSRSIQPATMEFSDIYCSCLRAKIF